MHAAKVAKPLPLRQLINSPRNPPCQACPPVRALSVQGRGRTSGNFEVAMSNNETQEIQQKLDTALRELEIWKDARFTREDGSAAQDRRFEERGESLKQQVDDLSRQLSQAVKADS